MFKPLSFYLITDTHFFEPSLGASGSAYEEYMKKEQMCLAENSAIADAVFDKVIADGGTNIVIIPGDLSKDGEMESHKSFIRRLDRLRDAGKKVYVITARHDYNDNPHGYVGSERVPAEGTKREQVYDLYYNYGYSDAIAFDEASLSYVAQLQPGVRMLAINSDGDDKKKGFVSDELAKWIKAQADKAKADGCFIFAINHYPIIPPTELFDLVGDAHIKDWRAVASMLADSGVNLAFTGHMHIQSINKFVSNSGNPFYDVCTSALVGSPAKYRKVVLNSENEVDIKSLPIPDFEWDMQGLTTEQYMNRQFDGMITGILTAMRDDYAAFLRKIGSKPDKKLKLPITLAGRFLNSVTLGGMGRLLWIHIDKSIRKRLLKDFAVEIVRNIFDGDQPYVEGTPEYDMMARFLKRFRFVLKKLEPKLSKGGVKVDINNMILTAVGNSSGVADNDAVLNLLK